MKLDFTKMHGLANDFVILDMRKKKQNLTLAQMRLLCDRKRGIGCDQLIIIDKGPCMRIINADGTEVENCGNALRCAGLLLSAELGDCFNIKTPTGTHAIDATDKKAIKVNMGKADILASPLKFNLEMFEKPDHISIGNPHLAFFVDDLSAYPLERLGPQIENHPKFPERINVEIARVKSADVIEMRIWERGAGLTEACGSGACAVAYAAHKRGLIKNHVSILMPGGSLEIDINDQEEIIMTGPATLTYTGVIELDMSS